VKLATLKDVARLFGIPTRDAEEALHSERAAKVVLSRRSFFGVAGALAAGSAFAFGRPGPDAPLWSDRVWVDQLAPAGGDGSLLFPVRALSEALRIANAPCPRGGCPKTTVLVLPGDYSSVEVTMPPTVDLRAAFRDDRFGTVPMRFHYPEGEHFSAFVDGDLVQWDLRSVSYDLAPG
jgi:hypothetical protein